MMSVFRRIGRNVARNMRSYRLPKWGERELKMPNAPSRSGRSWHGMVSFRSLRFPSSHGHECNKFPCSTCMNRFFMLLFFALLAAVPTAEGQWEKVNGPNGGNVLNLTSSGAGLFAQIISGSSGEVFISTDTGTNWNSFRLRSRVVQNVGGCGPYLFAWTQDTFYVSTNSGKTWIEDSNWIDSKHYYLNLFAQVGSNLYAAGGGIFQSSDGGLTWTALNSNLPNCYINGLTACNNNLYTLLAADSGLFRSTNNGKSWTEADRGLPYDTNVHGYTALHSIATIGTSLFVGTNSGVYRSTDSGNTWNKVNMVTPLNVWALTADGTKLYAATLSQGVFLSIDSGISWTQHGQGETLNEQYNYYNLITVVGSEIFVASADGIYRSNDTSGVGTLVGLPCLGISSFSANGNNLYADGFVSTDEGLNWSLNQNTLSSTSNLPNTLKYPFLVRMGKYLFVSTSRFAFGEADTDVFRSSDNGKTWYVDFEGLRPVVYGTLARLTGNRLIYAGSSDDNHFACFETDDFGISWNAVDSTSIFCCGNSNGPFLPKDICCPVPATAAQIGT